MKKTTKMAVSGVLTLTIAGSVAFSASAATQATTGALVMYHNIQGGPSQLTDSCTIEKNNMGTSYYANCTNLYNAKPTVTALGRKLEFTATGIKTLTIPDAGDLIDFHGTLNTTDNSNYSRANITIGS